MSKKESWKNFGKNTGNAFKNFGKAMKTTMEVAFTDKESNGELKKEWSKTGKSFGTAGKSLGKAASDTVSSDEEKKEATKPEESEVKDVDSKMKE